jgi:hypothetical protein
MDAATLVIDQVIPDTLDKASLPPALQVVSSFGGPGTASFQEGARVKIENFDHGYEPPAILFVDSETLHVFDFFGAYSTGTYNVYVYNPDGSWGVMVNALQVE